MIVAKLMESFYEEGKIIIIIIIYVDNITPL